MFVALRLIGHPTLILQHFIIGAHCAQQVQIVFN